MVMSSETTPVLSGTIPAFEMFMFKWKDLAERHPRLSQWIDIGMDKANLGEWAIASHGRVLVPQGLVVLVCQNIIY